MNTISNFFLANLAERLTPLLQTPVEDIVYEILDRKGLPTRSEIRDLKNRLERMDEEIKAMRDELAQFKAAPPVAAPAAPSVTASGKRRGRPPRQGPPPICVVDGCDLPVRSKGFCAKHYQAWRRGRLDGYVDPDGFVKVGDSRVKIEKRLAAQPFTAKAKGGEVTVTIKGKDYVRTVDGGKKKASAPKKPPAKKPPVKKAAAPKKPPAKKPPVKKKAAAKKAAPKKPPAKKPPVKKAAPKKAAPKKKAPAKKK